MFIQSPHRQRQLSGRFCVGPCNPMHRCINRRSGRQVSAGAYTVPTNSDQAAQEKLVRIISSCAAAAAPALCVICRHACIVQPSLHCPKKDFNRRKAHCGIRVIIHKSGQNSDYTFLGPNRLRKQLQNALVGHSVLHRLLLYKPHDLIAATHAESSKLWEQFCFSINPKTG